VEQDGCISPHCLIIAPPFLVDGDAPHDLSFKLISADSLPEYAVPSHLVNEFYMCKFSTMSSAVDVGSTVKLRCSTLDDTFSVVRVEDSGRLVLRLMGRSETMFLFYVSNRICIYLSS
jgi:hypothetical protein